MWGLVCFRYVILLVLINVGPLTIDVADLVVIMVVILMVLVVIVVALMLVDLGAGLSRTTNGEDG